MLASGQKWQEAIGVALTKYMNMAPLYAEQASTHGAVA
jgi:hypothetical protein